MMSTPISSMGRVGRSLVVAMLLAAGLPIVVGGTTAPAAALTSCDVATITWDGGAATNAWNTADNWDTDALPGPTDHVCIPAGAPVADVRLASTAATVLSVESEKPLELDATLTVTDGAQDSVFDDLRLDSGVLTGAGHRQIDGTLEWNGGDIDGPGETTANVGSTVDITTSLGDLSSLLRTNGTVTWDPANTRQIRLTNGTWEHGGTMTIGGIFSNNIVDSGGTNLLRVTSTGTITKTNSATATISVPVDNDGTITTNQSTLNLSGGSDTETSSGTYAASGTGVTNLSSGTHLVDGAQISGGGTVEINGTVEATGPLTVTAGSTLRLDSGVLTGAGHRQIDGTLEWNGGDIDGPGETTANVGSTVDITTSLGDLSSLLRTNGTVTWDPANTRQIRLTNGTWEHGGTMTIGGIFSNNIVDSGGTNLLRVTSTGTITKTNSATATISVPVDNDGTITTNQSTLSVNDVAGYDPVTDTLSGGTWAASGTGTLDLDKPGGLNGIQVLDAAISIDGPTAKIIDDSGAANSAIDDLASITSKGGLTLRNGALLTTPGPLTTAGDVRVGPSSSLTSTGLYVQTKGTTTLEDATASLTATGSRVEIAGGTLSGIGTVAPELRSTGAGAIAPGLSPGSLPTSGTAQLDGVVVAEIDGPTAGTDFDVVAISGAATVGGTLALTTDPAYDPVLGATFDLVTGAGVSGTFSGVTGLTAGVGKGYDLTYPGTSVRATVVAVPGADVVASAAASGTAFNVGFPGSWTVDVDNVGGAASAGTVTVDLTLGTGQTISSATGTGWTCAGTAPVSCSHTGGIPSGGSLPTISVVVDVTAPAVPTTTLDVAVAGGGDTRTGNNAFTASVAARNLTPPEAFFSASSTSITAPDSVSFSAGTSTGDIDDYLWDFGDGTTGSGLTPTHTYTSAGIYTVSLRVENEVQFDVALPVQITVLAFEPVEADAGDDRTVVVGTSTQFDGGESTPGDLDTWDWNFGDGSTASGGTVSHAYATPGTRTVTLTVTRGSDTDIDTATVTVLPATGDALTVTVTDGATGLANATVAVIDAFGIRYDATTDGAGDADIGGLPDGDYTAFAYAPGFIPAVGQATVANGNGTVTIPLASGAVASQTIESRRLTYAEIVAAGIDPADPANQNVYEFEICLAFGTGSCTTTFSGIANSVGSLYGSPVFSGGTCTSTTCSATTPDGRRVTGSISFHGGQPAGQFLLIPGEARWLKEFFEVQMVVHNLAPVGFTFEQGVASLDVPEGLALAPTSDPQDEALLMTDIAGGDSAAATWILRGDEAGLYTLTADYSAALDPVGASILLSATTAEPLQVWGGNALEMEVTADDVAEANHPYRVSITLTNVTDASTDPTPVYNPAIELKASSGANWIVQPAERFVQATGEIAPGGSFTADYVLIPQLSGVLNVAGSFVFNTGEGPDLADTISSQPRELPTPSFTGTPQPGEASLTWDPVPGAVDYVIYRTATPTTAFPVPPTPLATVSAPTTSVTVAATDYEQWYAIGTIGGDGISRLKHELLPVIVPPMIEPGSGVVIEGDAGTTTVDVAVGLSYPSDETVTVDWATVDVLDQPELGVDYEAASGTVTFLPGETSATVPITVIGDELDENFALGAEWIPVAFTNATNATIPTGFLANFGFGLIADDDPPPQVIPGSGFSAEGASGLTAVDITVDLSAPSGQTVTVDWATIDNLGGPPASAPPGYEPPVAGVDFESGSGTVTFAPGETSKTVSVDLIGDTIDEVGWIFDAEWGAITLSAPTNATLVPGFLNNVGFFLIVDDDP